jgi:hypothetical protein
MYVRNRCLGFLHDGAFNFLSTVKWKVKVTPAMQLRKVLGEEGLALVGKLEEEWGQ